MARSWPMHVMVLVTFLAATVDCARTSESKAIPKKRTFLEKLNNLVYLADRGFRTVGSNIKTLYGNFDLIGALATDKLHSSVRALESLEHRRKPVATTRKPDVRTPQPEVTTPHPDVTTLQPYFTTPQPDVTTPLRVATPHPVVTTTKTEACGDRWATYGASSFSFCTCTQPCSFNSARNKCRKKQAELAKCTSRELANFFVLSLNTSVFILLGGNDRVEEGTWRWPDRSLLNESYTNWASGEPNGGTEQNCLELFPIDRNWTAFMRKWLVPARRWYDKPCDYQYSAYTAGFVCEKKHL